MFEDVVAVGFFYLCKLFLADTILKFYDESIY